jgi:hypothetical protein
MDVLEKFRMGARKVGIQATAFARDSSGKIASGSRDFVQGFSLPGEAEKAAKILDSFLGASRSSEHITIPFSHLFNAPAADPERPESALNSIPKAVLLNARGE